LYEQALVHWQFHEHEQALATLTKIPAGLRAQSQQLRVQVLAALGRYDELPALLDALPESAVAKAVRREVALAKRIPAMVEGRDAPKDPAEAFACGVVCGALGRYEDAVFLYRQAGLAGYQLQDGVEAAVPAGDPIAKAWFRKDLDRLRRRVEKYPGSTRRVLEIYKRMPTMQSVRNDPEWRELWAELEALLARAKERTW
jgi:hypothetical protein